MMSMMLPKKPMPKDKIVAVLEGMSFGYSEQSDRGDRWYALIQAVEWLKSDPRETIDGGTTTGTPAGKP